MTARVAIVGGGTAGHVYPGLALAGTLRERGHDVTFLGTETGLEAKLVPAAGFPFRVIRARPFVRQRARAMLRAPFVAMAAVRESRPLVRRADVVVGMGGYVSVPAAVAAWREGVPLVLHEQNAIPGLANRALSRMARTVALSFGDAARFSLDIKDRQCSWTERNASGQTIVRSVPVVLARSAVGARSGAVLAVDVPVRSTAGTRGSRAALATAR